MLWADEVRAKGDGPFQFNLWIPDPPPHRERDHEDRLRAFLESFGPPSRPTRATRRPLISLRSARRCW
jgi:nitronate monooxygenase